MTTPALDGSRPSILAGRTSARTGARPTAGELVSLTILAVLLVAAVAPNVLAPGNPLGIAPTEAFNAPSWAHPFGTDESGRDVYTRVVHGASQSLLIGLAATAIGIGLALVIGALGAIGGRALDFTTTRITEVLFALPGLLLALVFIAIVGPGVTTTTIAVGLSTAPGYARIIRSRILAVRGSGYVEAAVVLGRRPAGILARHVLPNAVAPVFVLATLGVGQAIVWASSLSYLGLGVVPPAPEWGAMLAAGRPYIGIAWWMTVFPGLAIVATAASATALGRSIQARTRRGES